MSNSKITTSHQPKLGLNRGKQFLNSDVPHAPPM